MPTIRIHMKSRTTGSEIDEEVNVPSRIKGLSHVADYITNELANRYARSTQKHAKLQRKISEYERGRKPPKIARQEYINSWYDSHYELVYDELLDLRDKLRAMRYLRLE